LICEKELTVLIELITLFHRMVSLFDTKYKSGIEARRGLTRESFRAGDINEADVELFKKEVESTFDKEGWGRDGQSSGVDWVGLARVSSDQSSTSLFILSNKIFVP
jgi:hypothetical protein